MTPTLGPKCQMCGHDTTARLVPLTIPAVFTTEVYIVCQECYDSYQEEVVKPNAADDTANAAGR
jgi:hypothetical protein